MRTSTQRILQHNRNSRQNLPRTQNRSASRILTAPMRPRTTRTGLPRALGKHHSKQPIRHLVKRTIPHHRRHRGTYTRLVLQVPRVQPRHRVQRKRHGLAQSGGVGLYVPELEEIFQAEVGAQTSPAAEQAVLQGRAVELPEFHQLQEGGGEEHVGGHWVAFQACGDGFGVCEGAE